MEISIFFARFLGIYLLIMSLLMVFRKREVKAVLPDIFAAKGLLFFMGAINLSLGLVIAIIHPIWTHNWQGVITLLGYLSILKGIMRMGFYDYCKDYEVKMMKGYWIITAIVAILGLYLTYHGFRNLF